MPLVTVTSSIDYSRICGSLVRVGVKSTLPEVSRIILRIIQYGDKDWQEWVVAE